MAAAHDPTTKPSEAPSSYKLYASTTNDKLRESHQKELEQLSQWRQLESGTEWLEAYVARGMYKQKQFRCSKEQAQESLFQAWGESAKHEEQFHSLKSSLKMTLDPDALAQKNLETWEGMTEGEKGLWVGKVVSEEALVQYRVEVEAWDKMREETRWWYEEKRMGDTTAAAATSNSFTNRTKNTQWTEEETRLFYQALWY